MSNSDFNIQDLPVEVITQIFKFLISLKDRKACSLVCRSWYEAYQDPLFRNYEALHITSEEQFQGLLKLKNENRKFLHLVIEKIEIAESSLKFWERFGPNIKTLSINSCDIREKTFIKALNTCSQLESLDVQSCRELFMIGRLLEDENQRSSLREKLSSLTSLNLSYNRYLSDAIFVRFVSVFPNITKLLLAGCQISFFPGLHKKYYPNGQLKPSESVFTFPIILDYLQQNAKQLKYLSFNDTLIDNAAIGDLSQIQDLCLDSLYLRGCYQLSEEGILILSNHQKSLTELDLSFSPGIANGSLLAICSGLKNLKLLSVQKCRVITDTGVSALWQLEKLKYLNLSECDLIKGVGLVKSLCQKIDYNFRELKIRNLEDLTEDVIIQLSKSLPNLRVLDLSFCYNGATDKSIQAILENNRYLQTLFLTKCERITDSGLTGMGLKLVHPNKIEKEGFKLPLGSKAEIEIVREAKFKQEVEEICENSSDFSGFSLKNLKGLQHLDLSGCNGISDVSLIYGFELHELRNLILSHCNRITEKGLEHLSKNNKAIESLDLKLCENVNNEAVGHIVQNLKRLDTLILGSNKITDPVAGLISKYAKGLTYLDMRLCHQVSETAANEIINSLPNLHSFHFPKPKRDDSGIPQPPEPIGLWLKL